MQASLRDTTNLHSSALNKRRVKDTFQLSSFASTERRDKFLHSEQFYSNKANTQGIFMCRSFSTQIIKKIENSREMETAGSLAAAK